MAAAQGIDGRLERGNRTRRRIVDTAMMMASRVGLEGLSLGDVATELGISKGAITTLFGNKEKLQLAVLDQAVGVFAERVERAGKRRPLDVVRWMFDEWFAFVGARTLPGGCFMHSAISEYRARPGAVRNRVRDLRKSWRATVLRLLVEAKARGELREDIDPRQLAFDILACQASADTADLYGDLDTFRRAQRTVQRQLASARQP